MFEEMLVAIPCTNYFLENTITFQESDICVYNHPNMATWHIHAYLLTRICAVFSEFTRGQGHPRTQECLTHDLHIGKISIVATARILGESQDSPRWIHCNCWCVPISLSRSKGKIWWQTFNLRPTVYDTVAAKYAKK